MARQQNKHTRANDITIDINIDKSVRKTTPKRAFISSSYSANRRHPWSDSTGMIFSLSQDAGGSHPTPSPLGSRDIGMSRATSFPGPSPSLSPSAVAVAASSEPAAASGGNVVQPSNAAAAATGGSSSVEALLGSPDNESGNGGVSVASASAGEGTEVAKSAGGTARVGGGVTSGSGGGGSGSSSSGHHLRISVPGNGGGGGDHLGASGRGGKLERMSNLASGGAAVIIAPRFWFTAAPMGSMKDRGEGGEGGSEGTSDEDTSDEVFERRHTVRAAVLI